MTNHSTTTEAALEPIYVASRASIPERGQMWRDFRAQGVQITSSWIDEDGEGETADFGDLWLRITNEIAAASALVLYAERDDFPLKGALLEAGVALGMGKPVFVCLPDLGVLPRNYRPIGSWVAHPSVTRCDHIKKAVWLATRSRIPAPSVAPDAEVVAKQIVDEFESLRASPSLIDVEVSYSQLQSRIVAAIQRVTPSVAPEVDQIVIQDHCYLPGKTVYKGSCGVCGMDAAVHPESEPEPLDAAIREAEDDLRELIPEMFYGPPMFRPAPASTVAPQQSDELAQWSSVDNWPLPDVLNKLADATECLLSDYNYDRDGWEQLKYAALAARRHVALLTAPASPAALRDEAEDRPRAIFDAGFATTPPSTLAKTIIEALTPHIDPYFRLNRDWQDQIVAIIERCFSGGGEDQKSTATGLSGSPR